MRKLLTSLSLFGIICAPIKPPVFVPCVSTCANQSQPPIINNNNGNTTNQGNTNNIPVTTGNTTSSSNLPPINHGGGCAPYIPGTSIHYQCWYDAQNAMVLLNPPPAKLPNTSRIIAPHPTNTPAPLPKPIYHKNSKG